MLPRKSWMQTKPKIQDTQSRGYLVLVWIRPFQFFRSEGRTSQVCFGKRTHHATLLPLLHILLRPAPSQVQSTWSCLKKVLIKVQSESVWNVVGGVWVVYKTTITSSHVTQQIDERMAVSALTLRSRSQPRTNCMRSSSYLKELVQYDALAVFEIWPKFILATRTWKEMIGNMKANKLSNGGRTRRP